MARFPLEDSAPAGLVVYLEQSLRASSHRQQCGLSMGCGLRPRQLSFQAESQSSPEAKTT